MCADRLVVAITMRHGDPDPQRHRGHLAIDQAAYGVAAATTAPVNGGGIFRVADRGG